MMFVSIDDRREEKSLFFKNSIPLIDCFVCFVIYFLFPFAVVVGVRVWLPYLYPFLWFGI